MHDGRKHGIQNTGFILLHIQFFPFRNFSFEFLFNGVVFIQYWIKILLTQEEFGKLFHVTRQTVSNWENGKSYPDLQILVSMSNQLL